MGLDAYIQTNTKNNIFNRLTIKTGLEELGHNVNFVDDNYDRNIIKKNNLYYGHVRFINEVMKDLNIVRQPIGHVPDELIGYAGRKIERVTVDHAIEKSKTEKVFIKPVEECGKHFNGFVINNCQLDMMYLLNYNGIQGQQEVLMSNVIDIISEWRAFVCNGELLDSKHYKGNFRHTPNYDVADDCIKEWINSPIAYSLDLGITDKGETVVIECNDVFSLGWYGLSPRIAAYMLEKGWDEIYKN